MRDPKVIRNFQPYTSEQRANHAANFRMTQGQRQSIGEFFYTHADIPGIAFPTRKRAEAAGKRIHPTAMEAAA